MYEEDEGGATQVYNPDDPVMGVEWSVNVSDDETRTMRAAEVAFEFLRGALHAEDTFVWRDGLDDWIPLGQCQELQQIIRQYQSGQPSAAPEPHEPDFGATMMMDTAGDAAPTPAYQQPAVRQEVSRTLASPFESAPAAATSSYGGSDPFAGIRPDIASEAPHSRRVGERNEASALFSLKDLAISTPAPSHRERDPLEDLMNLGGGGGGIASAFAPPPIHAPAPPPPPPPPVQVVQASVPPMQPMSLPPAMMAQMQPPRRSPPVGLIIGASLGALALVGAIVAFAVVGGDDETTAMTAPPDSAEADTEAKDEEDKADEADEETKDDAEETAKAGEDGKDGKDGDGEKAGDDAAEDKTAAVTPTKTTDGKVDSAPKDDKKTDDKKEAKSETKSESKTEDKPEEKKGGKGEFNRDAARSALAGAAGAASGCKKPGGPTGRGRVTVTFAPSGRATTASVGPPFAGTAVGSCAAAAFKSASVPPFDGGAVTVSKSFFIK